MVLEEPEIRTDVSSARWIAASGCWCVEDGTLSHKCRATGWASGSSGSHRRSVAGCEWL